MYRYSTDFPNEVHLLMVSVSRHLYLAKAGELKYQKKPFEYRLNSVHRSSREMVVHYLLKDHFSGVIYAEVCLHTDMIPVGDFLHRAWARKEDFPFCGIPTALMVPKSVLEWVPDIAGLLEHLQINHIAPTGGFQAGAKDISVWEDELVVMTDLQPELRSFQELRRHSVKIAHYLNCRERNGQRKSDRWTTNIKKVLLPPEISSFQRYSP